MHKLPAPVQEKERLHWIDAARGFAIFGILIVNIGAFSAPYFIYGGEEITWNAPVDRMTQAVIDIFFQASFYTIFSFLFGFGLQLMIDRLSIKGVPYMTILTRRLLLLLGIGFIHAFFIWHGDILLTYAIVGLTALLFIQVKDETLLIWAISLLTAFVGIFTLMLYGIRDFLTIYEQELIELAIDNYTSDSIRSIWLQNIQDWMNANGYGFGLLLSMGFILPLFLLGLYVGRKRWLHQPLQYRSILMKLWWVSFILFIGLKLGPYSFGNPKWFSFVQDNIGGTFSGLFYILTITFLAQTKVGKKVMQPFIYVGRMALTNYIMQSIICFFLFYGIGLGWYGKITPLYGVGIGAVIYSLQIVWSICWLRYFKFGPLEWIWRSLTYNKKQPLRRKTA